MSKLIHYSSKPIGCLRSCAQKKLLMSLCMGHRSHYNSEEHRMKSKITVTEANVLEAAFEWANMMTAIKYGPAQVQLDQAENALLDAVAEHASENDGETPIHGDPR